MTRTRSSEPLRAARAQDSVLKQKAVLDALGALLSEGEPITVARVARRAGTSRQFVYSHESLADRVQGAQQAQRDAGLAGVRARPAAGADAASLQTDLHLAQQQIARLRQEHDGLRRQLRADLGARLDAKDATRASELLADKQAQLERLLGERDRLSTRVKALERQVRILTDELTAERAAHAETARRPLALVPDAP